ncbi:hypothetical protein [Actinoallomurus rhizosphaericola]|uniref:hypothetical protein n=1 Tax=Actinoallomurus rhizosphaericola TaxID=2952536 RepID=UPI002092816D|nr:hypothetical protein [Actinoallomurus rhizosphaericola]MCO6000093.1 hypothetical protein [Actinoallomurus rhizosphaericola]
MRQPFSGRRLGAATALTAVTLVAGGLAMAPAASAAVTGKTATTPVKPASSGQCQYILVTSGYPITTARAQACENGAGGTWYSWELCWAGLEGTNVSDYVVTLACNAAAD